MDDARTLVARVLAGWWLGHTEGDGTQRSRRKCALLGGVLTLLLTSMVGTPSALAQESCVTCHANHEFMIGVAGDSARGDALYVDPTEYAATVHGGFGFPCTTCHAGMGDFPLHNRQKTASNKARL